MFLLFVILVCLLALGTMGAWLSFRQKTWVSVTKKGKTTPEHRNQSTGHFLINDLNSTIASKDAVSLHLLWVAVKLYNMSIFTLWPTKFDNI